MKIPLGFLLALSLLPATADAADILIYGPADYYGESTILAAEGHRVTSWTATEWSAASEADFKSFDAIVVGDGGISSSTDLDTLYDTRAAVSE